MLDFGGIGARLRAERDRIGMNQQDFAEACGITRRTQHGYETTGKIPIEYLESASKLGLNTIYVLTGRESYDAIDVDEQMILFLIRQLGKPWMNIVAETLRRAYAERRYEDGAERTREIVAEEMRKHDERQSENGLPGTD